MIMEEKSKRQRYLEGREAAKNRYFKRKQEILEEIEDEKKRILYSLKENFEITDKPFLEKGDNFSKKFISDKIKHLKEGIERSDKSIKLLEKKEKEAELGIGNYDSIFNQLDSPWKADMLSRFTAQANLELLEGSKTSLFPFLCIGALLLAAAYYFMHQPKKTK